MKTHSLIILSLCLTCSLMGCAKIRQMTRRDFAVLNDPFLENSAIATPESAEVALTANASAASGTEGYARVGGPAQPQQAPKTSPFQMASRSRTIVPESTTAGLARIAAGDTSSQRMPTASAAPEAQQMDMADMSAFMKQQAEASGLTETAKDLEADFEAFAAARQKEWKQKVETVKQQAGSEVQQVADRVSGFGDAAMETAEPLIQQMSGQAAMGSPRATSVLEAVAEMPNPFVDQASSTDGTTGNPFADNPFGFDAPSANTRQETPTQATSKPSLSGTAANARSSAQTAGESFNDFAAFADSQLTGKISSQPVAPTDAKPFAELTQQTPPRTQQPAASTSFGSQHAGPDTNRAAQVPNPAGNQNKLDDKFGFDVGWRPANMERR